MRSIPLLAALSVVSLPFLSATAQAQSPAWQTDVGPDTVAYNHWASSRILSAVDPDGNLILAGSGSVVPDNDPRFVWIEKLDADGTSLWYSEWTNPNGIASVSGVIVAADGEIFVQTTAESTVWRQTCCDAQGSSFLDNVEEQVVLRVAGQTGAVVWTRAFARPTSAGISASHITFDSLGRLVSSGTYSEPYIPTRQYRHVLTVSGQVAWTAIEDEAILAGPCAAAASGAVVCVNSGSSYATYDRDIKVIRYASNGKAQWTRRIDDGRVTNVAADVVVDHEDNAIVVGYNAPNSGNHQLIRFRLKKQNGQTMWFQRTPLSSRIVNSGSTRPKDLGLLRTSQGDFIAAGTEMDDATNAIGNLLLRFDTTSGNVEWLARHSGWIHARAVAPSGDPLLLSRAGSDESLRHVDRDSGALISDTPVAIGQSQSLAVDPASGRSFALGVLLDTVSRAYQGLCAAFD